MKRIVKLAQAIEAYHNCVHSGNEEWKEKHLETANRIVKELPLQDAELDYSDPKELDEDKIEITFDQYEMNKVGMELGWSNWFVTITPKFGGMRIQLHCSYIPFGFESDVQRNDWIERQKDYLVETIDHYFNSEVE